MPAEMTTLGKSMQSLKKHDKSDRLLVVLVQLEDTLSRIANACERSASESWLALAKQDYP